MNFREHFEQWHLKRYGYKAEGKGTALNYTYKQPTIQARWEAWQACADWHTVQEMQADTACQICGAEGGTTCGAVNCGY